MPHLINVSNDEIDSEYNLKGFAAYDAQGEKLGDIDGVIVDGDSLQPRYVVVDTGGWFSSRQFVVPAGDIREIDDDERRVHFTTLTKQTLQSGQYPRYDASWWDTNDHEHFDQYERGVAQAYQPDRPEADRVEHSDALYQRPAAGAQRLQLLEERLRAVTQQEQAGVVRLGKRIVERQETVSVPVREERVVIERTPVQGEARGGAITGQDETIDVPVMRERAAVEKETVVTEEVNVRTEATERQEQVHETVRSEELVVEDPAQLVAETTVETNPDAPHRSASRPQP